MTDTPDLRARSCPSCHSIGDPRIVDRALGGNEPIYCRDPWHSEDPEPERDPADNGIEQIEARLRRRAIQRAQWLADSLRVLADWVERKPSKKEQINYVLLQDLGTRPHPNLNHEHDPDLPTGVGEVLMEALAAQHLLDIIGIPLGAGDAANIDARVYLAVLRYMAMQERLSRLAGWHSRETGPAGMVGDFCNTCGEHWPCDTRRLADGTYVDSEDSDVQS